MASRPFYAGVRSTPDNLFQRKRGLGRLAASITMPYGARIEFLQHCHDTILGTPSSRGRSMLRTGWVEGPGIKNQDTSRTSSAPPQYPTVYSAAELTRWIIDT
ncbi:hypothetical protein MTP99_005859 [Tenebrio molitor]|nr:hypothetical protein MTP99_005859 [Tenebrio molitor]